MKKTIIMLNFLALIIYSTSINAQENSFTLTNLSFEDALQITSQNSLIVKQGQQSIKQKQLEKEAALGLYMPKISINASYMIMSEDIHLDLNPVKDAITPVYSALGNYGVFTGVPNPDPTTSGIMPFLPDDISTAAVRQQFVDGLEEINASEWDKTIQKKQFGTVSANFTMPLYTGGKIRTANTAAKIKVQEADAENNQKVQELSCELIERYYGLVLAKNAQKIREEVLDIMSNHLNDAEKLMNEGIIAKAEFLHAKVYHSAADRELKKVNRQVNIVNDALLNTLAIKENTEITPISNLFFFKNIKNIDYYWEKAQLNSPLLKQIETKKNLAHQAYKIEKAEFFPTIAAMGTYDLYNKDLSPYIPEYMVGVGLKWNLFTGTERIKKLKASKVQEQQVETYYDKAEFDINTAITKYYQEIQMNIEQLNELESALEFATEYFRVRESAFKEGMATTTEVSDASLAVAKVKIERLEVMYSFDIALSKLLYYSGISDEFTSYVINPETIYESY